MSLSKRKHRTGTVRAISRTGDLIKSLNDIEPVRMYLTRVEAEPRSLKTAIVRESHGAYRKDLAIIKFGKDGEISCKDAEFKPTEEEQATIAKAWAKVTFPEPKPLKRLFNLPKELKQVKEENLFVYRDLAGDICMVQVRTVKKGERAYIPWSYWSDDVWRNCEPEGALPLYGAERVKEAATVYIHEGAKAARYWQRLCDGESLEDRKELAAHPWGLEMSGGVHLGWTGGAMSPGRTDWSILERAGIKEAYIIADNDAPGIDAVQKIAEHIRVPTYAIIFNDEWPASFDLADPMPEKFFDGGYYTGATFHSLVKLATWVTDMIVPEKGKPYAVVRDAFKSTWAYVQDVDLFVCREFPHIQRNEAMLNRTLAPFSHVSETAKLLVKSMRGQTMALCYRPDVRARLMEENGNHSINLHSPTDIRARKGDAAPWLEFLAYLIPKEPKEEERKQLERWCATLIARPDLRMGYAVLLISETQGIGKTTLASSILAPLVGVRNVGFASESDILSEFNDWVSNKQLVIVPEIYTSHSWKSYQVLKSAITDKDLAVNQKFQRRYRVDNWAHILASSNSRKALKIEGEDRRWFCPKVQEQPWNGEKFVTLRRWLRTGGLAIIKHWAEHYRDYVMPHERAPMTVMKAEIIEDSLPEYMTEAMDVAQALADLERPAAIGATDLRDYIAHRFPKQVVEKGPGLRRLVCKTSNVRQWPERIRIGARREYLLINTGLWERTQSEKDEDGRRNVIRANILTCNDLMNGAM